MRDPGSRGEREREREREREDKYKRESERVRSIRGREKYMRDIEREVKKGEREISKLGDIYREREWVREREREK
jgi:hypothetical protein